MWGVNIHKCAKWLIHIGFFELARVMLYLGCSAFFAGKLKEIRKCKGDMRLQCGNWGRITLANPHLRAVAILSGN